MTRAVRHSGCHPCAIPTPRPSVAAASRPQPDNTKLLQSAVESASVTRWPSDCDRPKSPRAAWPRNRPYCITTDWSSPRAIRTRARALALRPTCDVSPLTLSPGASRSTANPSVVAVKTTARRLLTSNVVDALSMAASKLALAYRPKLAPMSVPCTLPHTWRIVVGLGSVRHILSAASKSPFSSRLPNTCGSTAAMSICTPLRRNCACTSTAIRWRVALEDGTKTSNVSACPPLYRSPSASLRRQPSASNACAVAAVSNTICCICWSIVGEARVNGPSATLPSESSALATTAARSIACVSAMRTVRSLNSRGVPLTVRVLLNMRYA